MSIKLNKELYDAYGVKPVDAREFEARMSLKANLDELVVLKTSKINVEEYLGLKEYWEYLKRQFDQVVYLFSDYLKSVIGNFAYNYGLNIFV